MLHGWVTEFWLVQISDRTYLVVLPVGWNDGLPISTVRNLRQQYSGIWFLLFISHYVSLEQDPPRTSSHCSSGMEAGYCKKFFHICTTSTGSTSRSNYRPRPHSSRFQTWNSLSKMGKRIQVECNLLKLHGPAGCHSQQRRIRCRLDVSNGMGSISS